MRSQALDLRETLATAEQIAQAAGHLLRKAFHRPREISYKGEVNLVTQADRDSEAVIVSALREHFPDYAILSEEGDNYGLSNRGLTWVIDPLDGTTNFAHGYPLFAISIALLGQEGLLIGVVYDPLRDELFSAARGQGATLNGVPMQVSQIGALQQSLLATGFPYDRHTAEDNNTVSFARFIRLAQGVRRDGAAAMNLAYVACGRLDGFWELRLHPWDVMAGILLVREAGGIVTAYDGGPDDALALQGEQIVASNGHIHGEMIAVLRELYRG